MAAIGPDIPELVRWLVAAAPLAVVLLLIAATDALKCREARAAEPVLPTPYPHRPRPRIYNWDLDGV